MDISQSPQLLKRLMQDRSPWFGPVAVAAVIVGIGIGVLGIANHQRQQSTTISLLGERRVGDTQLARMVNALANAKLTGFDIDQGKVMVPAGRKSTFLAALDEAKALPPEFHAHTGKAVDDTHFLESERDRRRRFGHAEEKDLAAAIEWMPGIESAMVQYDESETRDFNKRKIMTASVSVLTSPGHKLRQLQVRTIRQMVANARAGLEAKDVGVTDLSGSRTYDGSDADAQNVMPDLHEFLSFRRTIEEEWHEKIRSLLRFIPGVHVVTHVDLSDSWHLDRQSRPSSKQPTTERVSISVQVPESYYRMLRSGLAKPSRVESQSPTSETMISPDETTTRQSVNQRIRESISALVAENPDVTASIHIVEFNDTLRTAEADAATSFWASIWQNHKPAWLAVFAIGVAVAVLPWLRQSSPTTRRSTTTTNVANDMHTATNDSADVYPLPLDENELRGTLTELVREDPDSAAEILHDWLDRAG